MSFGIQQFTIHVSSDETVIIKRLSNDDISEWCELHGLMKELMESDVDRHGFFMLRQD